MHRGDGCVTVVHVEAGKENGASDVGKLMEGDEC